MTSSNTDRDIRQPANGYAVKFCVRQLQLLLSTMIHSTCSLALRQDWPIVYIETNSIERAEMIARQINRELVEIKDELAELSEVQQQGIVRAIGKHRGLWMSEVDITDFVPQPVRTAPIARKPKFRRPGKHTQLREAERNEQQGRTAERQESSPIQTSHRPVPKPLPVDLEQNELAVRLMSESEMNLSDFIDSMAGETPDEKYQRLKEGTAALKKRANKLDAELDVASRRRQELGSGRAVPAVLLGEFPQDFDRELCIHLVEHYKVKPQSLPVQKGKGKRAKHFVRIYIPGETESKLKDKVKKWASRKLKAIKAGEIKPTKPQSNQSKSGESSATRGRLRPATVSAPKK